MAEPSRPRVLLGNLEPMMLVGLRRVLADDGVEVVGQKHTPGEIVNAARRLQPDAVVLDLNNRRGRHLGEAVQEVAPDTKVILWARDETVMEVLDPSADETRLVALTAAGGLRSELNPSRHPQEVKE